MLTTCLLTACSSMTFLNIETYKPATITFPEQVKKILIVNNAVAQSPDVGYELKMYGVVQDTCKAVADSALYYAVKSLGDAIVEANYFEDVLLYNYPIRTDDQYLADPKLSQGKVRELCAETGTDAIISFDRLLFQMYKNVIAYPEGYLSGGVRVNAAGVLRVYLPTRQGPQTTAMVTDSISFVEYADDLNHLDQIMLSPDESLVVAGRVIGHNSYPLFVPFWKEDLRWYYKGSGTKWQEASAYAKTQKWDQAALLWEQIYRASSGKAKAKAASNMALYHEMKGEFQKASDWSVLSYDLFKTLEGEEGKNAQILELYKQALSERVTDDTKLNIQIGEY
ncbi:DUF6340 family protein [Parabacteroides sp. OttesenSCG-928-K15]|nr:DUF6340 family protein [Parabacteroides sp. OttesenSCG-928-K15]